ncbi:MAG: DNA repair protein RecN [Clostridia bacterium]|nr:DNA repair protein RecN [Clostridia bacterium]
MLLELTIKNIALIESLRIEWTQGFNVITGETGTGKSIVVDSVNLALGGRADRDIIRTGVDRGEVQALFDISDNPSAMACARDLGIDVEDGLLVVRRELNRNGKNVCRLSGVIVPLSALRALTALLMDVHGQHEHQALLDPAAHIRFLDAYGGAVISDAVSEVAGLHAERGRIASMLKKLLEDVSEKERLHDILSFQVQEIDAAKLRPGEEDKLKKKLAVLENAEKIREGVETACTLVYQGDGRELSAQEALLRAATAMERIADIGEKYAAIAGRLREAYYTAQDLGYELQAMMDDMEFDPDLIDKISSRLDLINRLERKYGATVEDVLAFGEDAGRRLEELKTSDASIAALKKQYKEADARLRAACGKLTELRKSAALRLSSDICQQLGDLGMAKTRFEVRVEPLQKPASNGMDSVEFMISPNPGEPLRPLADIASGGEISRVMLALKAISLDSDGVDAMVFDEIDTGVSGRMAQVVGEKICLLSRTKQVLCITHLPQIAALGDSHFMVEKVSDDAHTQTFVRRLDDDGRIRELSRLVGGAADSESSLSHAAHMLREAAQTKKNLH